MAQYIAEILNYFMSLHLGKEVVHLCKVWANKEHYLSRQTQTVKKEAKHKLKALPSVSWRMAVN